MWLCFVLYEGGELMGVLGGTDIALNAPVLAILADDMGEIGYVTSLF